MTEPARGARVRERMSPEETLGRILLVQACEESDPEGRFLPMRERQRASQEARAKVRLQGPAEPPAAAPDEGLRFLAARARRLSDELEPRHPSLRALRRAVALPLPLLPVLLATSALGLGADALGGERRINLLAFPLLALLLWNALLYLLLAASPLVRRRRGLGLAAKLTGAAAWLARRRLPGGRGEEARWLAAASRRFTALWIAQAGPLLAARVRRALHVGALGFALGLVAGMYVRGIAFEYHATWESTFLDAQEVSTLLGAVLGPAAHVLDALRGGEPAARALLDAQHVASVLSGVGHDPAAPWIHLWALTAAGAIGVPRLLLAVAADRRARRLASRLAPPLGAPYYLRLRAADRGAGVQVVVWPYSHELSARSGDALRELLHELFGNHARIEVAEPLPYGAEAPPPPAPGARPGCLVVVFNLAQPPEQEVHGVFLEALQARRRGADPPPSLLVLLDEEAYRARFGAGAGRDRLAERRRAWERVARSGDLRFAALRPLDADADAVIEEARAALWPAAPGEAA